VIHSTLKGPGAYSTITVRPTRVLATLVDARVPRCAKARGEHPISCWARRMDGRRTTPSARIFWSRFGTMLTCRREGPLSTVKVFLNRSSAYADAPVMAWFRQVRDKWVEISIAADPLYQHLLLTAEKKFWSCVKFGEPPRLFGVGPPRPRIEAVVDMGQSNSWAQFAAVFRITRSGFLEHEKAKTELKGLMPEDAKEAFGHGIRAKRSKSGAVSFEMMDVEASDAPVE
jgi:hypothetical protein